MLFFKRYYVFMGVAIINFLCALILSLSMHFKKDNTPHDATETEEGTIEAPVQNKEPLLVFAGGGSVRNYLWEVDSLDVRDQPNSINIAMASGSAWRVLAEQYHNDEANRNNKSLNKFITVCLSAGKITQEFYDEYMSYLDTTIIAEVYLGEDNLVAYISNVVLERWDMLHTDAIQLEVLAQNIQNIIEKKEDIAIYTTNKLSGTLEQYKKSFQDLIPMKIQDSLEKLPYPIRKRDSTKIQDSITAKYYVDLEKMLDDRQAFPYYEKTNPEHIKKPFIILGSEFYGVKKMPDTLYKGLRIINPTNDNKGPYLSKSMYLYFLAYQKDPLEYKVNDSIIGLLEKIEKKKTLNIKDWKKLKDDKIIEHLSNDNEEMKFLKKIN